MELPFAEARAPDTHPVRAIKRMADAALSTLAKTVDAMYSRVGSALDSTRAAVEGATPDHAVLKRSESVVLQTPGLRHPIPLVSGHEPRRAKPESHSTFSANCDHLLQQDVAWQFVEAVAAQAPVGSDQGYHTRGNCSRLAA